MKICKILKNFPALLQKQVHLYPKISTFMPKNKHLYPETSTFVPKISIFVSKNKYICAQKIHTQNFSRQKSSIVTKIFVSYKKTSKNVISFVNRMLESFSLSFEKNVYPFHQSFKKKQNRFLLFVYLKHIKVIQVSYL